MPDGFAKDIDAVMRIDAVQKILEVICRTTGLGFSAVARVTDTRWIACAVRDEIAFGLVPGGELKLETTICNEIRRHGQIVAIDHVAEDKTYCAHPTPQLYGFQSYISVPIVLKDGAFFGTLCAIDPRPARVSKSETIEMFKLFADLIGMHLENQQRLHTSEAALLNEREASRLRDQFIAVLGHDLRNPLAAIGSSASYLQTLPQTEDSAEVLEIIQRSTVRMADLIGNILDFARGKLGDGLSVHRVTDDTLGAALQQVVTELQSAWPTRTINRDVSLSRPVTCDSARVAQMLSNLLANALAHGDPQGPIRVDAHCDAAGFEMSVANVGKTIPPAIMESLFKPFSRGTARPGQQGLGLGLYIASEIARAHGGTLTATSSEHETRFTFRMPLQPA